MGYGLHLSAADFRGAQGLTQTAAVPGRRVAKGFVLATIVINMLGVGLAWPVLPKIIQHMGGGDVSGAAFTYGVLAGGFALAQFFFQPLTGVLSDRFGRKPILLAALAGAGADFALVAWAPSLIWVAAARILGGIFASTNATANAYMADISEPEDRSRNFGLVGAAFGFGFIAGPLIGGVLGGIDLRLPFLFAAGLAALNFTFGLFFLPESLAPEDRKPFSPSNANPFGALARLTRLPGLAPLMLSLFLVAVAQRGLEATWVLFLDFRMGRARGLLLAGIRRHHVRNCAGRACRPGRRPLRRMAHRMGRFPALRGLAGSLRLGHARLDGVSTDRLSHPGRCPCPACAHRHLLEGGTTQRTGSRAGHAWRGQFARDRRRSLLGLNGAGFCDRKRHAASGPRCLVHDLCRLLSRRCHDRSAKDPEASQNRHIMNPGIMLEALLCGVRAACEDDDLQGRC